MGPIHLSSPQNYACLHNERGWQQAKPTNTDNRKAKQTIGCEWIKWETVIATNLPVVIG